MTDREENKRLRKIVVVLSIACFLLVIGFVAYLSYGISKLNSIVAENTETNTTQSVDIEKLTDRVTKIESQTKIPGPQGKDGKDGSDGKDGTDSVSTVVKEKTTTVKQVPVNGKDGKNGRDGEDARQIVLCRLGELIGWAYAGTNNCMPVEELQ